MTSDRGISIGQDWRHVVKYLVMPEVKDPSGVISLPSLSTAFKMFIVARTDAMTTQRLLSPR